MLQALLQGIDDDRICCRLLEETETVKFKNATMNCRLAEASTKDFKSIKTEVDETVHELRRRGEQNIPDHIRSGENAGAGGVVRNKAICTNWKFTPTAETSSLWTEVPQLW